MAMIKFIFIGFGDKKSGEELSFLAAFEKLFNGIERKQMPVRPEM